MLQEENQFPQVNEYRNRVAFKRLLLAKELYLHGLNHSFKSDALDKMIAVHNFHNAIEIALRSIILHYEIRLERQLNIEFEVMLNEIDNHQGFRDLRLRLPYRQELRNLNQMRNWVQHHAIEPELSTMEDWRVFTRRFLIRVSTEYFQLEFETLSPIDMISDPQIKALIELSYLGITSQEIQRSLMLSKIAYEWARKTITEFIPQEPVRRQYVDGLGFVDNEDIVSALNDALSYAALLSTGINIVDYKRFQSCTPSVRFTIGGNPDVAWGNQHPNLEDAKWVNEFVINAIVHWQTLGLSPAVPEYSHEAANLLIQENRQDG